MGVPFRISGEDIRNETYHHLFVTNMDDLLQKFYLHQSVMYLVDMQVVELGGGENPNFHPNLDGRPVKGVDIVADLESPLPLKSEAFDFVFSQFAIEHISWKRLTGYIADIFRILKPNGKATIITADLRAQFLYIMKKKAWDLTELETIFGSQDYPQNTHKSSMSMELAERLFRDAGFGKVKITQVGICATDMQIEVEKMERAEMFDRKYFDGKGYGTGKGDFYRDFPQHYKTAEIILQKRPQSVLEIGGARGYICKILQAHGVPASCMDISKHCWHTRAIKEFYLWDATNTPWFGDFDLQNNMTGRFDICFSIAFLEHVPEDKLEPMIKEMARVTKRGLHGITFTVEPNDQDTTHVTIKPLEWWQALFKRVAPDYPVEIVNKDLLEEPVTTVNWQQIAPADGLLKLNIGCFADMFYYGWKNVDAIDLREWAKFRGYEFIHADVKEGIKVADNTVDIILASHFLEHLNREDGAKFIKECYRVLKPDGILRLAVPDAQLLASHYLAGTIMEFKHVNVGVDTAPDEAEAYYRLLLAGHQTIYDTKSLTAMLSEQWDVKICKPFESTSTAIALQTISMYPTLSLYLEAKKHIKTDKACNETISESESAKPAPTHVETTEKAPETPKTITDYKKDKLKIALFSTPLLTVPPINYGGLEMIVADLGRELALLGHDVTIFAPKGSKVEGCRIYEIGDPVLTVFVDWLKLETDMFTVAQPELMSGGYDIIHGHNWFGMEYRAKALDNRLHVLHTHHGGLVADWWLRTRPNFKLNMVGISEWMKSVYERQGMSTRAVHNGVNPAKYPLRRKKGDRYLYLSRIAFFKAPHVAIQIAKETGIKLDVAGATQFVEDAKYVEEIKKSCDGTQIRWVGEVSNGDKLELMSNAKALIVPALWGEPFGLHVIESMMVGTPVLAIADGGIKETIKKGGVLCQDVDTLKDAIQHFKYINPLTCRKNAMMFSTQQMALNYEKAYRDILSGNEW